MLSTSIRKKIAAVGAVVAMVMMSAPTPAHAATTTVWSPCQHRLSVGYAGYNPHIAYGSVERRSCQTFRVQLVYNFFGTNYSNTSGCYAYPQASTTISYYGNPVAATSLTGNWYESSCWSPYTLNY